MSLMVVLSLFIQILYLFDQTQCQFSLFLLHTNSSFIQLDLVVLLSASSSNEFFNNFLIIIANINKSLNELNGSSLSLSFSLSHTNFSFIRLDLVLSLFFIRILYSFDQIQYYCSLSLIHTNLFYQTQCQFSLFLSSSYEFSIYSIRLSATSLSLSLPRTNSLFVPSIRRKYNDR